MALERDLDGLKLERKRSVTHIAKHWGDPAFLASPETPRLNSGRPGVAGRQLLAKLAASAKELQGRVAGRNSDDAGAITRGLEALEREWALLERGLQDSERALLEERQQNGARGPLDATPPASSPDSADSQYVAKQQHRIQQLEEQEAKLQVELQQIKGKWESIMARTMEQQAAIHRHQLQEREALVAQQEAEIRELRRRLPEPAAQPATQLASQHVSQQGQMSHAPATRAGPEPARRGEGPFRMAGRMVIGQTLQILGPCDEAAPEKLQWYRVAAGGAWEPISGATRKQYSPEPFDVGFAMGCCISPASGQEVSRVSSKQPVAPHPGFEEWVASLAAGGGAQFRVVVVQRNGMLHTNREPCLLDVGAARVALLMPNAVTLQQPFHAGMKVCGARGAGDAAAQGVFLAFHANDVYMLACETARERNACILLIRQMAARHGLALTGPEHG